MPSLKEFPKRDVILLILISIFLTVIWGYRIDLTQALWTDALPYAAWFNDKNLFVNDLYRQCFSYMPTLFYPVFSMLTRYLGIQLALYGFLFFQDLLIFLAIYFLALVLFKRRLTSWLSVILVVVVGGIRYSLGIIAAPGVSVVPSLVALPVLIGATGFFLEKKYFWAMLTLAIAFNFHISLTILVGFVFLVSLFWRKVKKGEIKSLVLGALVALILVLPLVSWLVSLRYPPGELPFDQWLALMRLRNGWHSFPSRFGLFQWVPFLMVVLGWFFLRIKRIASPFHKEIIQMIGAIILICLGGTIFTEIFPLKFFVSLYPFRVTFLFTVFVLIYFSYYLETVLKKKKNFFDWMFLGSCLLVLFLLLVVRINTIPAFRFLDFSYFPVVRVYTPVERQRDYDWLAVQKWAKVNTPKEKLILVPPTLRGFRAYSQRGIVIAWEDVNYPIYYPHTGQEILKRLRDFGIDPLIFKENREAENALAEAYRNFTEEDFLRIAKKYNVSYAVVQRGKKLSFPEVYSNRSFVVYLLE